MQRLKTILLDIEGTTTPIDFVHDTLFPFAQQRVGKFVEIHFAALHDEINDLVAESAGDGSYTIPVDPTEPGSVSSYLEHLIDEDRKSTPLKSIQGKIWKEGYEAGELRARVFDDVPGAFEQWNSEGKTIAIFSSGSVLAQQLLFRYTDHGDLTGFISDYFDTSTGPKADPRSYAEIVTKLGTEARETLFISDVTEELDAARESGLVTAFAARPGNPPAAADITHRIVTTFEGLE